jgi:hypothetical protein
MSLLIRSIKEKQALLIKELFINTAKVRDILGFSLAVIARSILFPLIIPKDVYKLILGVSNTALGINKIPMLIL